MNTVTAWCQQLLRLQTKYIKRLSRHSGKQQPGHCDPQGTTGTHEYLTTNKTWPRRRADKVTVNYQWHFGPHF